MTFAAYLERTGESASEFSRRAKINQSTVSRLLRGCFTPRGDTIQRIVAATKGEVTADDLLAIKPRGKRRVA